MNANRRSLRARRWQHWANWVCPVPGPDGLHWLTTDDDRLLGLDRASGERRVEQASEPGSEDRYELFTGYWPHRVIRRDAPARPIATVTDGHVVTTVDGRETGRVPLPSQLAKQSYARLTDEVVWILQQPTRGKTHMRVACLDIESQTFGEMHELDFFTNASAVSDQRIAFFDEASGRVHVFDRSSCVGVIQHTPSECWGSVAVSGDQVAVVSHRHSPQPGAVVAVCWTELRQGVTPALVQFALRTQGATTATFLEDSLAVHQYGDVTLIARDALRAVQPGQITLVIEDVATPPPTAARTARVTFVGATTGFGFVESETLGRLRFKCGTEDRVAVGDVIALDDVESGVVRQWHRMNDAPRPLDPELRCLKPALWAVFEVLGPLPVEGGPAALPEPEAAFCTAVRSGASLTDPDEDDEAIEDVEALQALDGTLERSGDLLDLVDDEFDVDVVALRPTLRFAGDPGRLHLALEFYTRQEPSDRDLARFQAAATRLLDSGWGLNYEFDPPSGYDGCHVALDYSPLGTSTRRLDEE